MRSPSVYRVLVGIAVMSALLAPSADAQLTRADAIAAVTAEVISGDPNEATLVAYAPQSMLTSGDVVAPFVLSSPPYIGSATAITGDTWFVWIDDRPSKHFVHDTRFVYVDATNPAPTIGNGGIVVDPQGWWPQINGADFYADAVERHQTPDKFFGSPPDGPVLPLPPPPTNVPTPPPGIKKCAILVSGSEGKEFEGDIADLEDAMQNIAGVPAGNIQTMVDATKAEFEQLIANANAANCDKLYVHIGSHGWTNSIVFDDGSVSADDLAECLGQIQADDICITIESCRSGSLVDEIQDELADKDGVSISATDAVEASTAWVYEDGSDGNSYFICDFIDCWGDPQADGADAGNDVDHAEAYAWVLANGSQTTKDQNPLLKSHGAPPPGATGIPTVSEVGLGVLALALAGGGAFMMRRRRALA